MDRDSLYLGVITMLAIAGMTTTYQWLEQGPTRLAPEKAIQKAEALLAQRYAVNAKQAQLLEVSPPSSEKKHWVFTYELAPNTVWRKTYQVEVNDLSS